MRTKQPLARTVIHIADISVNNRRKRPKIEWNERQHLWEIVKARIIVQNTTILVHSTCDIILCCLQRYVVFVGCCFRFSRRHFFAFRSFMFRCDTAVWSYHFVASVIDLQIRSIVFSIFFPNKNRQHIHILFINPMCAKINWVFFIVNRRWTTRQKQRIKCRGPLMVWCELKNVFIFLVCTWTVPSMATNAKMNEWQRARK